jgi:acetate---CoA ligase (ADP-forming) subunit beta
MDCLKVYNRHPRMKVALSQLLADARAAGRKVLDEPAAKRALSAYGLAVPRGVTLAPGAEPVLEGLSGPFAVKLVSPDASHKSDVGGVRLGLPDAQAVGAAVQEMQALARAKGLRLEGVLVEEMAPAGVELAIGGVIDARFGPVLMLGLGGVFIEIFADTAFRVCPLERRDALDMIDELRAAPLLRGARGRAPVDEKSLIDAMMAIGGPGGLLVELESEIAEIDINPLIISAGGAVACDARIVLPKA